MLKSSTDALDVPSTTWTYPQPLSTTWHQKALVACKARLGVHLISRLVFSFSLYFAIVIAILGVLESYYLHF